MKKVLFATTALVATTGFAMAGEVNLSGYAEIGVQGGDVETQFHHDIDVKFSLSGETDNGLTFGATIDLDEVSNGISNRANPSSVFISGNFGTLTMGDTDGAFDWAMTEVFAGTAIADDHSSHSGASGNSGLDGSYDGQIARWDYSFGDFGVALSAEIDDDLVNDGSDPDADGVFSDAVFGIGLKYSADLGGVDLGLGLGYQSNDTTDIMGISVKAAMAGGFDVVLNYSDSETASVTTTHSAIGVHYNMGPLLVGANYGQFETGAVTTDGYGVIVNYDLGGGAVVMAGYGSGDAASGNGNGTDTWSLGLGLSF